MSTWISEISPARAGFARAVLLAAVLPLAGCFGPETGALSFLTSGNEREKVARDVMRKVALYEGEVVIRPPGGYCIDRRTLRRQKDGGFALLASCESLSGVRGQAVEPVVMTVSVLPNAPEAARPGVAEIARLMAPAKVLASHETTDVTLVQFASGGDGVLPDGDARHWRGGMMLGEHLIGLALYARKGSQMAGKDGRALLTDLARRIRRASPGRSAPPREAAPNPEPGDPDGELDGLSTDSG